VADLTQRLSLIVDATGDKAEATFKRLATSASTSAKEARDSGADIAKAAQRVADARLKEADALGRLSVEERRLQDIRDKGTASGGQIAAAEERVASARRRAQAATHDLGRATEEHAAASRQVEESAGRMGEATDKAADRTLNLRDAAQTLAGTALVGWLTSTTRNFVDQAMAAQGLAQSMNASVEEGGRLVALFGSLGLEADDLLEIQAEFAAGVEGMGTGLTALGTELQHNADGTVNWAATLTDTLAELQKIPDATERNRLGFQMFGEEGYKQLSRLLTSGVSVEEAIARIGTPFTQEDIDAAQEFSAQMTEVQLAAGDFARDLARVLLPIVGGVLEGLGDIGDVLSGIPTPMLAAGAGAVALGLGMRSIRTEGGMFAGIIGRAQEGLGTFASRAAGATSSLGAFRAAAGSAVRATSGLVGGPLGAAFIGVGVGVSVMADAVADFEDRARTVVTEAAAAAGGIDKVTASSQDLGEQLLREAGVLERFIASTRGARTAIDEYGGSLAVTDAATGGMMDSVIGLADQMFGLGIAEAGAANEIDKQREALGAAAIESQNATDKTRELSDMIAEGTLSGEEFTGAVRTAAEAQLEQERTSGLAEAAIEAYRNTTDKAFEATLNLASAVYGSRGSWQDVLGAIDDVNTTTDNAATLANEAEESYIGLGQSVLGYAQQAGDAAVAAAEAQGQVVDSAAEAEIRARATMDAITRTLDQPDLAGPARREIEDLRDRLIEAQENGDIQAVLELTGAAEASGEIDAATKDRDTQIRVESRNGPAVVSYLDGIASAKRLALVRVESRNGPAVAEYLRGLAVADRLALIRVESRNGPAARDYINSIARQDRLAIIRVESRNGPAVDAYLDNIASNFGRGRTATIDVTRNVRNAPNPTGLAGGRYGAGETVNVANMTVQVVADSRGRISTQSAAEAGRQTLRAVGAYKRLNGIRE
jgi:hypothetical protein